MNSRVKTEIAFGVIFTLAVVVGGLFFLVNRNPDLAIIFPVRTIPLSETKTAQNIPKNDPYYEALATKCHDDTCCLDSVSLMKQGGFKEINRGDFLGEMVCQYGSSEETTYIIDSLSCIGSLAWCSNDPVAKKKWQEIQAQQKNQNQEMNQEAIKTKEVCEKKSGKVCTIVLCDSGPECQNVETGWQPVQ